MLVLTCKEDTVITIGEKIKIRVYKVKGAVRIAIEAPRELSIVRTEGDMIPLPKGQT